MFRHRSLTACQGFASDNRRCKHRGLIRLDKPAFPSQPAPREQLARGQPVSPRRHRHKPCSAIALRHDPVLLVQRPTAPAPVEITSSREIFGTGVCSVIRVCLHCHIISGKAAFAGGIRLGLVTYGSNFGSLDGAGRRPCASAVSAQGEGWGNEGGDSSCHCGNARGGYGVRAVNMVQNVSARPTSFRELQAGHRY